MSNMSEETTVAGVDADAASYEGGQVMLRPANGFGTAYAVGETVWGSLAPSPFAILAYNAAITGTIECFGPDDNGKLESLGTLPAGWVVVYGNVGSDEGASSRSIF